MKTIFGGIAALTFAGALTACSNVGFDQPSPVNQAASIDSTKVDIVLIIDTSMTNDLVISNLATSLPAFFAALPTNNLDWQACLITTDVTAANAPAGQDGALLSYAGEPVPWAAAKNGAGQYTSINTTNPLVLNAQTPNLANALSMTAQYIQGVLSPGQGNAQGIGALYQMVKNYSSSGCFRSGASLAAILLSPKDENGTYGSCNRSGDGLSARGLTAGPNENFCEPVAAYEDPATAKAFITTTLNTSLTFNSIIVQPGDSSCLTTQTLPQPQLKTPNSTWVSPAFYGNEYVSISNLTGGSVSSICSPNNYATTLSAIRSAIVARTRH